MTGIDFLNTEYFFKKLYELLTSGNFSAIWDYIRAFLDWLIIPATLISLLLIVGIVYANIRAKQVEEEESHKLGIVHGGHGDEHGGAPDTIEVKTNQKWARVEKHINSANPSDWRLAILEADIMLDEMLEGMGYHSPTLGDKLKSIEKSDFTTLDKAWEAHNVRNAIAHEGADYLLNEREARRVIALFSEVFREFHYI